MFSSTISLPPLQREGVDVSGVSVSGEDESGEHESGEDVSETDSGEFDYEERSETLGGMSTILNSGQQVMFGAANGTEYFGQAVECPIQCQWVPAGDESGDIGYFQPQNDRGEILSWRIEVQNDRLVIREGGIEYTLYYVEVYDLAPPIDIDWVYNSIEVDDGGRTFSIVQNSDGPYEYTIARLENIRDDQNIRRPTRTNANTDDISPDRLTDANLRDIVAFVHNCDPTIQVIYPEFIWDTTSNRWERMEMPDQILERDGDNWHMYNNSVSVGQVTLSYGNLPNNLTPVPSTY